MTKPKTAEPTERTEAQILTEIDSKNVALVTAKRETDALLSRRRSLLIEGNGDGVHEIGSAIARASNTSRVILYLSCANACN